MGRLRLGEGVGAAASPAQGCPNARGSSGRAAVIHRGCRRGSASRGGRRARDGTRGPRAVRVACCRLPPAPGGVFSALDRWIWSAGEHCCPGRPGLVVVLHRDVVAAAGAGRRHRGRRHRHLDRLPPGPPRGHRRAAARARPADLRHHVARRGPDDLLRLHERDEHGAAALLPRPLRPPRGGDRGRHRVQAGRADRGGGGCRPAARVPPGRGLPEAPRPRGRGDRPARDGRAVPAGPHRRPARRLPRARRRSGQPGRRHDEPGPRRPQPRGPRGRGCLGRAGDHPTPRTGRGGRGSAHGCR